MTMFVPEVGKPLTVTLPGELMRAIVKRVLNRNTAFVEIGQPMTRSHNYRKGDLVACKRKRQELGEIWEALDDRATAPEPPPPEPAKPKRKRAAKKVVEHAARGKE